MKTKNKIKIKIIVILYASYNLKISSLLRSRFIFIYECVNAFALFETINYSLVNNETR